MSSQDELSRLEFAALISSRICHDVISPVGAIANGFEVLADETDEEMRKHAFELIKQSAGQASAKLQFARLAFGAAGSQDAKIDLRDAESVTRGILDPDKHQLEWSGPIANVAKNKVKLLLNMAAICVAALPRGGQINVTISGEDDEMAFSVRSEGERVMLSKSVPDLLNGNHDEELDAHAIQPFYTYQLAIASNMVLKSEAEIDHVTLSAAPSPSQ